MDQHSTSEPDYQAVLTELLLRFRDADMHDEAILANFARAGAEALEAEASSRRWLGLEETAALLGLSADAVRNLVESGQLAVGQTADGEPRFSRLEISLCQSSGDSQSLGAVEDQARQVAPPPAGKEAETWGVDPQREITPG